MATNAPAGYAAGLQEITQAIQDSVFKSFIETNTEILTLYWGIGNMISQQQSQVGKGTKIIGNLTIDLQKAFPQMKGLSVRNLSYMRQFAASYPDLRQVKTKFNRLTWYHHITLLSKVADQSKRISYIKKATKNSWSRDQMLSVIQQDLVTAKKRKQNPTKNELPTDC